MAPAAPLARRKVPNIWTPYGLASSPFFQEPLEPAEAGPRPITLFVGREEAAQRLLVRFGSNEGSRTAVEGAAGVGKTTFIQFVKARATDPPRHLAHAKAIRVTSGVTHDFIGAEIVKTVLRTLTTCFGEAKLRKLPSVAEARKLVEAVEQLDFEAGISVLGSGGHFGRMRTRHGPARPPTQYHDLLEALVTEAKGIGVEGILVHIDNLENIQEDDIQEARQLFRDIRDYLLIPGLHYILAGTSGLQREVLGHFPQVGSIFPDPISLEPLDMETTLKLLKKRYQHLRLGNARLIPPVEEAAVRSLHEAYRGDLRGMLNALNDAAEAVLGTGRPLPMNLERILPSLQPSYRARLERDLTATTFEQLEKVARLGHESFRQTDLTEPLALSAGRVNQVFREWLSAGAVRLVETRGRSKYYTLAGYARIAFGAPLTTS
ncbi:MAG: AAA family ATPase [Planctomycetota bacterium]